MAPSNIIVDGLPRNKYVKRPDQAAARKHYQKTHLEQAKEYYRAYRARYPERGLHRAAKNRAKQRGLAFDLEFSDIQIPPTCPILGIPILVYAGHGNPGGRMDSPSLDRIDPLKGYIKGNIQVISHKANSMKFNATKDELLKFANWVHRTFHD